MKKFSTFAEMLEYYLSCGCEVLAENGIDLEIMRINQVIDADEGIFLDTFGNKHTFEAKTYYYED